MNEQQTAWIIDRCIADVRAGRATVSELLGTFPELAPEMRALGALAAAEPPHLPRAPRQAGLERLLGAAQEWRASSRHRPVRVGRILVPWRLAHVVLVLAPVLCLCLLGAGTVNASSSSLPGDYLYGVKLWSEQVWLDLAPAGQRPLVHLRLAERRLEEVEALMQEGRPVPSEVLRQLQQEMDAVITAIDNVTAPPALPSPTPP